MAVCPPPSLSLSVYLTECLALSYIYLSLSPYMFRNPIPDLIFYFERRLRACDWIEQEILEHLESSEQEQKLVVASE